MDELDRLYRRLVQNIRTGFPDLLTRQFEVAQIYQQLVPYRLNRRELEVDTNEEYELALMQLLSGARGLLSGDEEMQRTLRTELESPNPDLTVFRTFATSWVSLAPEALRALDGQPLVRSAGGSEAPAAKRSGPSVQAQLAARATEEVAVAAQAAQAARAAARPASGSTRSADAPGPRATRTAVHPTPAGCRFCGGEIPDGREVNFCPHCGQNLSIKQCPACSTELDSDWRFCVTCGRQVD
jgi:hypothetical protein